MILLTALAAIPATAAFAQPKPEQPKTPHLEFTTVKEVPITSIKNQNRSGDCWCFSALSFLESEVLKSKGIETDLSEMYVIGKSYHDRADKYIRVDGALGWGPGSEAGDVLHVIADYGIVPEDVYHGMNYGSELPDQGELDAVTGAYVDAIVKSHSKKLTTAWLRGFDGIIQAYLGEWPTQFEWEGQTYTPESYRDYLGINPDDYVALTSFTHHPFYSEYAIDVHDNWRWDTAYNLPLDEFMDVLYNAIDNGYSVLWSTDCSEKGFTRTGIGIVPEDEPETKPATSGTDQERWVGKDDGEDPEAKPEEKPLKEKEITQELRQQEYDLKQTTDDHGMHIYGTAVDQNGNKFFLVKNSWGESGEYKGIWYCSDAFVRFKTIDVVVNKNAIPEAIRTKLGIR